MIRAICSVLLVAGLLAGCGNTGDLYLPDAAAAKPKKVPRITDPTPDAEKAEKDDESEMETKP